LARQPLGKQLNELIQLVLNRAFTQVHQQCHQGRQRKGALAGKILGAATGTRRELIGI
jgi:hypothetical protein